MLCGVFSHLGEGEEREETVDLKLSIETHEYWC